MQLDMNISHCISCMDNNNYDNFVLPVTSQYCWLLFSGSQDILLLHDDEEQLTDYETKQNITHSHGSARVF